MDYKTADCKYSIFCQTFGDWKCKKICGSIREEECETCTYFEKFDLKKDGEKPACRCEICEERGPDEE